MFEGLFHMRDRKNPNYIYALCCASTYLKQCEVAFSQLFIISMLTLFSVSGSICKLVVSAITEFRLPK